jgi:hypothetical protein
MTYLDPRSHPVQSLNAYVAGRQLEDRLVFASIKRAARSAAPKKSNERPPRPQFRLRAA